MKKQIISKYTVSKFSLQFLALLPGVLLATSAVTAHAETKAEYVARLAEEARQEKLTPEQRKEEQLKQDVLQKEAQKAEKERQEKLTPEQRKEEQLQQEERQKEVAMKEETAKAEVAKAAETENLEEKEAKAEEEHAKEVQAKETEAKAAEVKESENQARETEAKETEAKAKQAEAKAVETRRAEAAKAAETAKAAEANAREAEAKAVETRKAEAAKAAEAAKETEASKETKGSKAEIQSAARPFGLDIAGPVMKAGSDEKSAVFQKEVLPEMTKFLNGTLGESSKLDDSRMLLDADKLKLKTASDVRVYFVGEGAGYANTLGFDTTGKGIKSDNAALIFPNASSPVSTYDPSNTTERQSWAPLLPGDFVSLGKLDGGSMLDFFLIANGANGGRNVFSTDRSANADGINHVVAFAYQKTNSPYLILGFEDLFGGGDRDFNDLIFAVEIGASNVKDLTSAPEPAMALTLVSFLGMTLRRKRSVKLA